MQSPDTGGAFEWVGVDVPTHSPDAATDAEVRDAVEQAESADPQLVADGGTAGLELTLQPDPSESLESRRLRLADRADGPGYWLVEERYSLETGEYHTVGREHYARVDVRGAL